jgi:hypothetical protein
MTKLPTTMELTPWLTYRKHGDRPAVIMRPPDPFLAGDRVMAEWLEAKDNYDHLVRSSLEAEAVVPGFRALSSGYIFFERSYLNFFVHAELRRVHYDQLIFGQSSDGSRNFAISTFGDATKTSVTDFVRLVIQAGEVKDRRYRSFVYKPRQFRVSDTIVGDIVHCYRE